MTEVFSNLKPDPEPCPCGCGVVGRPTKKGHVPLCDRKKCASCRNRANRKGGMRKQRTGIRALGAPVGVGDEENIGGGLRTEVKSGGIAGPVWTKFLASEKQSEQNRPIGDFRPFVALFMGTGTSDGLVVFRLSKIAETTQALYEQLCADGEAS